MADPEPRTVLEAGARADAAGRPSGQDRVERSRKRSDQDAASRPSRTIEPSLAPTDPRRSEALHREVQLVREQVDRLILRAARGCDGEPCALFLVTDGFYEEPAAFYLGEHRLAGIGESRPLEEASEELAQTVAALRVDRVPACPVREDRIETPVVAKPRSDYDVFLDHTGAISRAPKASDREPAIDWDKLEVSVTPILQPLVRLAAGSGGAVLRIDRRRRVLRSTRCPSRRRLFYLTDRPLDGDLRPVSARMVQSGAILGTPAWVRSSTPAARGGGARARGSRSARKLEGGRFRSTARIERDSSGQATLIVEAKWDRGERPLAPIADPGVGGLCPPRRSALGGPSAGACRRRSVTAAPGSIASRCRFRPASGGWRWSPRRWCRAPGPRPWSSLRPLGPEPRYHPIVGFRAQKSSIAEGRDSRNVARERWTSSW